MTSLDPRTQRVIRDLAKTQHDLKRQVARLNRGQDAGHITIHHGRSIQLTDADDNVVRRIGADGTKPVDATPPPRPAAPSVAPGQAAIVVATDGDDEHGETAPDSVVKTRVYATTQPPLEAAPGNAKATITDLPGETTIGVHAGVWHVGVVWVTESGQVSELSEVVEVEVEAPVDVEDIDNAVNKARTELEQYVYDHGNRGGVDPPTEDAPEGVIYYQKNQDGQVIGIWQSAGDSNWTGLPLDSAVLASVTTDKLVAGESLIDGVLIKDGAITLEKMTVTEELMTALLQAKKIEAGDIAGNAIDGMIITGATIQTLAAAERGIKIQDNALRGWNNQGSQTIDINGTNNLITGEFKTNAPNEPGIILFPTTSTGQPGIWFSEDGSSSGSHPAIFVDDDWNINVQAKSGPNGRGRMRMRGGIELVDGGVLTSNGYGMSSDGMITPRVLEGWGALGMWGFGNNGLMTARGAVIYYNTNFMGPMYYQGHGTTGSSSNVFINASTGLMARSTSARRYKANIQTANVSDELLNLEVSTWDDKAEITELSELKSFIGPLTEQDSLRRDELENMPRKIGMIADEVEAIDPRFVTYDKDGKVDGLAYDRLAVALFPIVRRQRDRITALEQQNADLEQRLARLEENMP